ncbi:MAG: nitroreductase [Bacteroidetes bacterium]|nr:MAG: nitroreductase [Bacteroidota bacterium]
MTVKELVYAARSVRRFDENKGITPGQLRELIDLARMTPCAKNVQWLRYVPITSENLRDKIFPTLGWAGFLTDWDGPAKGERPAAYIVVVEDTAFGNGMPQDSGFALQSMVLGAQEMGIAECIIYSVNRPELSKALALTDTQKISFVLALGYPAETVSVVDIPESGSTKYWREGQTHYVPKRKLDDVIIQPKED